MILLLAVVAGLLFLALKVWLQPAALTSPHLRGQWLVPAAALLQTLVLLPFTANTSLGRVALPVSLGLLLAFAGRNIGQRGFWLIGIGMALNLLAITANGGLMPISPETASKLYPHIAPPDWQTGVQLVGTKDILLPAAQTHLLWLTDRFLITFDPWLPFRTAFSLGDVLLALGIVQWLGSLAKALPERKHLNVIINQAG